jgi:hypothetical protein
LYWFVVSEIRNANKYIETSQSFAVSIPDVKTAAIPVIVNGHVHIMYSPVWEVWHNLLVVIT